MDIRPWTMPGHISRSCCGLGLGLGSKPPESNQRSDDWNLSVWWLEVTWLFFFEDPLDIFFWQNYFSRRFHFAEHFWDALSWLMLFAPFLSFLMFCQRPTWIHLGRVVLIDAVGVLKITQPTSTLYHISSLGPAIKVQHCNLCSPGFGWVEFRLHQTFWRETKW